MRDRLIGRSSGGSGGNGVTPGGGGPAGGPALPKGRRRNDDGEIVRGEEEEEEEEGEDAPAAAIPAGVGALSLEWDSDSPAGDGLEDDENGGMTEQEVGPSSLSPSFRPRAPRFSCACARVRLRAFGGCQ